VVWAGSVSGVARDAVSPHARRGRVMRENEIIPKFEYHCQIEGEEEGALHVAILY